MLRHTETQRRATRRDRTDDLEIEAIDFDDKQLSKLARECRPPFELVHTRQQRADATCRESDYLHQFSGDEPLELLRKALSLLHVNLSR